MLWLIGKFSANLWGIVFMTLSAAVMTGMAVVVRHLAEGLHPFQIAFFRNLFGVIILMPLLWRNGLAMLRTDDMGLMAARGIFNATAMLSFFVALTMLPLAEISALMFTVPLFVALMVAVFLKERLGPHRVVSLFIGFSGALVILRPGIEIAQVGALYVLFSAITWGSAVVLIKRLSRTNSSVTITFYGLSFLTLFTFVPALFVWEWPGMEQYGWLIVIAAGGTVGQLMFTQSLKMADATLVMPFDFTKLIWAAVFGFLIFSEIPTVWTLGGGAIIFASSTYITYREGRRKLTASSPAPAEVV
ncbi:MAG: DMT family transporter [Pseudomonadota bacterium]|nr:DMT family transporter [Pseudomonadota bacterium]